MMQQILDDNIEQGAGQRRFKILRTPLLKQVELATIIITMSLLLFNLYLGLFLRNGSEFLRPVGPTILILVYLFLWRKSSIDFDNNTQQEVFTLPRIARVFQILFCLSFALKGIEGVLFIKTLVAIGDFERNSLYAQFYTEIALDIALVIICVFYFVLTYIATRSTNRTQNKT